MSDTVICNGNGVCSYSSSSVPLTSSNNIVTFSTTPSTGIVIPNIPAYSSKQENTAMDRCGVSINCTIPDYAYPGLNFLLTSIGLAAVILACTVGFYWFNKAKKLK